MNSGPQLEVIQLFWSFGSKTPPCALRNRLLLYGQFPISYPPPLWWNYLLDKAMRRDSLNAHAQPKKLLGFLASRGFWGSLQLPDTLDPRRIPGPGLKPSSECRGRVMCMGGGRTTWSISNPKNWYVTRGIHGPLLIVQSSYTNSPTLEVLHL